MSLYRTVWTKTAMMAMLASAFVVGGVARADAAAALQLTSGGSTVTVQDNGAGDVLNATNGAILWAGSLGVYNVVVTSGTTYPALGSQAAPQMDLGASSLTSTAAGDITLLFTQTDFSGLGSGTLNLGGTQTTCGAGCTITYEAWWNPNNVQFAMQNAIDGVLTSTLTSFALSGAGAAATSQPYSLTQRVTIHRGDAGITSFDAHLSVPEPASMTLLGLGLLGAGFKARRRLGRSA